MSPTGSEYPVGIFCFVFQILIPLGTDLFEEKKIKNPKTEQNTLCSKYLVPNIIKVSYYIMYYNIMYTM